MVNQHQLKKYNIGLKFRLKFKFLKAYFYFLFLEVNFKVKMASEFEKKMSENSMSVDLRL
jgi:hypothetical protein